MSYYWHSQRIKQHPLTMKTPVATNNQGFFYPPSADILYWIEHNIFIITKISKNSCRSLENSSSCYSAPSSGCFFAKGSRTKFPKGIF